MEAFPLRGFQEAVKFIQRGAANHCQSGRLVQGRRSVSLPAREFDFVAAEAQRARTKIAVELDEDAVGWLEVRLDERVLLVANAKEVGRNGQPRRGHVDYDLGGDVRRAERGDEA